jgi:hypothetical protein
MINGRIHFWTRSHRDYVPMTRHLRFFHSWKRIYGVRCFTVANFWISEDRKSQFLNFGAVILNFGIEFVSYPDSGEGLVRLGPIKKDD